MLLRKFSCFHSESKNWYKKSKLSSLHQLMILLSFFTISRPMLRESDIIQGTGIFGLWCWLVQKRYQALQRVPQTDVSTIRRKWWTQRYRRLQEQWWNLHRSYCNLLILRSCLEFMESASIIFNDWTSRAAEIKLSYDTVKYKQMLWNTTITTLLGGFYTPPLGGMLVHHRLVPSILSGCPNGMLVPLYAPGWREGAGE